MSGLTADVDRHVISSWPFCDAASHDASAYVHFSPEHVFKGSRASKGAMRALPDLMTDDIETIGAVVEDFTWSNCWIPIVAQCVVAAHCVSSPRLKTSRPQRNRSSPLANTVRYLPIGTDAEIKVEANNLFERISGEMVYKLSGL